MRVKQEEKKIKDMARPNATSGQKSEGNIDVISAFLVYNIFYDSHQH